MGKVLKNAKNYLRKIGIYPMDPGAKQVSVIGELLVRKEERI